jgi:cytochrome c556
MVVIDEHFDHLKVIEKAGWKTPPSQADLAPAHEATLLWEQFRELARTEDTAKRPEDYRTKLAAAERAAAALRAALGAAPPDHAAASAALKESTQQCSACHKGYRNEKKN